LRAGIQMAFPAIESTLSSGYIRLYVQILLTDRTAR